MDQKRQLFLQVQLPKGIYWAAHDLLTHMGKSPLAVRQKVVAEYVQKLMQGGVMSETKNYKPMGYRRGVKLAPFLLNLPEDTTLDLAAYSAETGVAKEAVITLAIVQFLRANRTERRKDHE
jgi:hypothetical protein